MTLPVRKIDLTFSLGEGSFGGDGANAVTVSGLRTSVTITRAGGVTNAECHLRVWGLPLDVMQKLTVLNVLAYQQQRLNTVTVMAGDSENGMALVFSGTIKEAWADASNAPDVLFTLSAYEGLMAQTKPIPATSYSGAVSASTFFSSMAKQIADGEGAGGYNLENNGVEGVLADPYWPGTVMDQIRAAARALRCNAVLDQTKRVLAIWPLDGKRGDQELLVSAGTGLVGYPTFSQTGINFSMLFNPGVAFGQAVQIESTLAAANGTWVIAFVQHNLDAELPGGQWFTQCACYLFGSSAPIIGSVQ